MQRDPLRRSFIIGLICAGAASGCEKTPTEVVQSASTPIVQGSKIALRGYQIVAAEAGEKLIRLPHPAVRILGVFLVISAAATELVIDYLDDELQRREIREVIKEEQKITIERNRSVIFELENGRQESVRLGDNRY